MGTDKDRQILEAVLAAAKTDGDKKTLSCADAHHIADQNGVERRAVGEVCNRESIRITTCQLGLFP